MSMNRQIKKIPSNGRGFTLIELMVSLSIFSIIIVVVAGAYLNIVSVDRQTRTLNELVNNLSFVTDSMSRDIRAGTNYCDVDQGGSCNNVSGFLNSDFIFTDQNGCLIHYFLTNGRLEETESGGAGCATLTNVPLTGPNITITNLSFYVYAPGNGSGSNAFVTYMITGQMQADALHTEKFSIESSAAERTINL